MKDLFTIEHFEDDNTIMLLSIRGKALLKDLTRRILLGEITREEAHKQIREWVIKEGCTHVILGINYSES